MRKSLIMFAPICCCFSNPVAAQLLTNDNTTITINGVQLTVKGDILERNSATITNTGTIDLSGNWINNAGNNCFGISQGTVVFNGANQSIGGTSSTVFNHLTLSGSGTKTLLIHTTSGGGNALPAGVLSLNDRYLDLNGYTLTIANPSPSAITRTSGFAISETPPPNYGIIQWNMGSVTAGNNFTFPFGNAGTADYVPLGFNVTGNSTGATGYVSAATYPTLTSASPNNRPLPTGLTSLMNSTTGTENAPNVVDRWWIMDVQNYTTNPTSTMVFSYRDSEWDGSAGSTNTIVETQLQAQVNNGTVWSFPPTGVVNTVANTVTVSGVTNYNSLWTLVGNSQPLPVELISFTAEAVNNQSVLCRWTTATEINNDYFTVERSRDGANFEPIGTVDGAGNSTSILQYQHPDHNPYRGISYYRLQQTDFDGQFSYSAPVAVRLVDRNSILVSPTLAAESFTIFTNFTDGSRLTMQLYTADGRLVLKDSWSVPAGTTALEVPRGSLAPGAYFANLITHDGRSQTFKLIFR